MESLRDMMLRCRLTHRLPRFSTDFKLNKKKLVYKKLVDEFGNRYLAVLRLPEHCKTFQLKYPCIPNPCWYSPKARADCVIVEAIYKILKSGKVGKKEVKSVDHISVIVSGSDWTIKITNYKTGLITYPDSWDTCDSECSNGIHFLVTQQAALDY